MIVQQCLLIHIALDDLGVQFRSARHNGATNNNSNIVMIRHRVATTDKQGNVVKDKPECRYAFVHYFARAPSLVGDNITIAAVTLLHEKKHQPIDYICMMDAEANNATTSKPSPDDVIYMDAANIERNVVRLSCNLSADKKLNLWWDWCVLIVDDRKSVDIDPPRVPIKLPLVTPATPSQALSSSTPSTLAPVTSPPSVVVATPLTSQRMSRARLVDRATLRTPQEQKALASYSNQVSSWEVRQVLSSIELPATTPENR